MRHWRRIEAFRKTYPGKPLSFGPLALEKRVVLVMGENGSGKTTMLKCLSGLIRTDEGFMNHGMEYVAGGAALPGNMKARAYLDALLKMAGDGHVTRLERLKGQFDLTPFLDCTIQDCSDGMRQRLALVGGLLKRGRTVLLDEPMRTLDSKYRRRLVEWIAQSKGAFLVATHEPGAYRRLNTGTLRL